MREEVWVDEAEEADLVEREIDCDDGGVVSVFASQFKRCPWYSSNRLSISSLQSR